MIHDTVTVRAGAFSAKDAPIDLEMKQHRSGLYYRTGVSDLLSIQECFANYKTVLVQDRVVLDLGANVGGFSHMAITGGAKEVYSFEPEPYTYALLVKNIGNSDVVNMYNRVISNRTDEFVTFYVGHGAGSPSLASAEKVRGRRLIPAKNQNFKTFVDVVQPHTIKIDIEGGEYGIVGDIPDSCDEITLEWHGVTQKQVRLFKQIYPMFMSHGWTVVTEKKRQFYKKHSIAHGREPWWVIDAHYRR